MALLVDSEIKCNKKEDQMTYHIFDDEYIFMDVMNLTATPVRLAINPKRIE